MNIKPRFSFIENSKLCTLDLAKTRGIKLFTTNKSGNDYLYKTEIVDTQNQVMGVGIFGLLDMPREMFCFNMQVSQDFRHRNLGELLHLAGIINMLENNLPHIKLYSKENAVYFHSKYQFEPDIVRFSERDNALNTIAQDTTIEIQDIVRKAKDLIKKIALDDTPEAQRQFCKEASKIAASYINAIQKLSGTTYQQHPFKNGFDMILTKLKIKEHSSFFNELFQKHHIDYQI